MLLAEDVSAPRKSSRSNKGKIAKRKFDPCAAANASAMENADLVERMNPNDSQWNEEDCGLDDYSHSVFIAIFSTLPQLSTCNRQYFP
jgi:hypothetical protein